MHHSAAPDHAGHDTSLIAAHAAGDAAPNDTAAAALLASCSACAELHRDLITISAATRALPRTARSPRDFRLTAEQAARLRRGSWLRAVLAPFGSPRSVSRSLAPALTSAGIAGLLIASFAPALLGGAASAPSRDLNATTQQTSGAPEAPVAVGVSNGPAGAAGAPTNDAAVIKADDTDGSSASGDPRMEVAAGAGSSDHGGAAAGAGGVRTGTSTTTALVPAASPNPVIVGSLAMLAVGLALFGLRFAARRLR